MYNTGDFKSFYHLQARTVSRLGLQALEGLSACKVIRWWWANDSWTGGLRWGRSTPSLDREPGNSDYEDSPSFDETGRYGKLCSPGSHHTSTLTVFEIEQRKIEMINQS